MSKLGLIQVYTGDGKGKTTAAIGLASRALGHGLKVCYINFHKGEHKDEHYGEIKLLKQLGIDMYRFAEKHPHFYKNEPAEKIRQECLTALKFIEEILKQKKYALLILDEILISVRDKFISEEELLELLNKKPENLEIVLTGRSATEKIIEKADLVSEIKKIKHPFDIGMKRRKGIEY